MKKILKTIFISALFSLSCTAPAHAIIPVTDYAHITVTELNALKNTVYEAWKEARSNLEWAETLYKDGKDIQNYIEQVQHRYEQIQHQISVMRGIDASGVDKFFTTLHQLDAQMAGINASMTGMLDTSDQLVTKFSNLSTKLQTMAGLSPTEVKQIVDNAYQAQRDNVVNGRVRMAGILEQTKLLNTVIADKANQNHSAAGIKETAQIGNDIALQQMALHQSTHETLGMILKQAADENNQREILLKAMQAEASKTFQYTPQAVTVDGPGLYHIQ